MCFRSFSFMAALVLSVAPTISFACSFDYLSDIAADTDWLSEIITSAQEGNTCSFRAIAEIQRLGLMPPKRADAINGSIAIVNPKTGEVILI